MAIMEKKKSKGEKGKDLSPDGQQKAMPGTEEIEESLGLNLLWYQVEFQNIKLYR